MKQEDQTKLAKAMSHPLRVRIINNMGEGISSPNRLSQELGEPLGNVAYHVKVLLECECIEPDRTEPRRGAVEHFYRAKGRLHFPTAGVELSDNQRRLLAGLVDKAMSNGIAASYTDDERQELAGAASILNPKESA